MHVLESVRRALWLFVELGFLLILAVILVFLLLGDNSGVFVKSVADNVIKFAGNVPTASLIGIGALAGLIYIVVNRLNLRS